MKNDKKTILTIILVLIIMAVIGVSYAFFSYSKTGEKNQQLILGDIWLNYTGSNTLEISDATPNGAYSTSENGYFEFTISGMNDYTEKDIYYDINLVRGAVPTGKSEEDRISDEYLMFKLVEVNNNVETELFTDKTYSDLTNQRVYVATVPKNTTQGYSKTYRLYIAISSDLIIGNVSSAHYTPDEWANAFASISVKVTGDFEEKSVDSNGNTGISTLIASAVPYATASASNFTGGLVAINGTEGDDYGTLYNENNASHTIREYRYSGPTVNNYVFFDTDGDSLEDDNEIWRIVGMFKNSSGEWNLKLMRNTKLTSAELPSTYTYSGTSFTIEYHITGYAYWNSTKTGTNYNDWTTAGLQYWLNGTDSYYGTLSNGAQALIDTSYIYYLGNVTNYGNNADDTTITSYTNERKNAVCGSGITSNTHTNNCDIWYGNKATWNGKVALLYPSDYGYSASSSYWSGTTLYNYNSAARDTSWMYATANHTTSEWMLSPSSNDSYYAARWDTSGFVGLNRVNYNAYGVRPVLNLKFTATIDTNHQGDENDPYILGQ